MPVYVSQPQSAVLVPAKRLAGFTRVSLAAGQQPDGDGDDPDHARSASSQGDIDASGPRSLEHGEYVFSTGTAADAVTPSATNTITLQ